MRWRSVVAFSSVSFVLPALALWACSAALPGPPVCSERDPCTKGRTCVLGRCRKDKTMPISTNAPVLRFEPVDIAWVDDGEVLEPNELGDRFVLGRAGHASAQLYLRFAVAVPPAERLQRALLTLEPLPSCARSPGRMTLELLPIMSPWRSSELSTGRRPELDTPLRVGEASVTPPQPLRLDVTELVRAWSKHKKRHHGVVLMATGDSATGACFTSGTTWGTAPTLSVYLWPEESDAGADGSSDRDGGGGGGGDENGGTGS